MSWWQTLVAVVGAFGGFEFIKWVFNRKRVARTDEFKLLRETNEFLQQQLNEKEQRFVEQTQLVRRLNTEILDATRQAAQKDVEHVRTIADKDLELARVRCDDHPCPFRQPPNAYTPPRAGLTKEQYHANKKQ